MEKLTFVSSALTENTGGNVMVDFLKLDDGKILAISSELIGLYIDMQSFDNGDEPISFIER
jgi:hypothetical protein